MPNGWRQQNQTTVSDGWVRLDGELDRWSQREEAEQAVGHLTVIRGVTNPGRGDGSPPIRRLSTMRAPEDAAHKR